MKNTFALSRNIMRRIFITTLAITLVNFAFAQADTIVRTRSLNLKENRTSNDHFLIQLGHTIWTGKPDSINTKGWSRSFNAYLMLDFPFKTNPKWSVALGPGISTENMFFKETYVGIKENSTTLKFTNQADTNHFKKYKLAVAFLEAPVELRFRSNTNDDKKSVKFAIGAKIGMILNAHVKGKELQDKNNNTLTAYTQKESSKRFFNKNRLSVTGRAGYGHFSLFGSYAITPLFKEGFAAQIRPFTFGLTLSGL